MSHEIALWAVLAAVMVPMLVVDFIWFGRGGRAISTREACAWSIAWTLVGLAFALVVWWLDGAQSAGEYVAGYLVERSLSVDNLFVFALIFSYFGVPAVHRQRVLLWGVIGALVLRVLLISVGVVLIERFAVTLYVFGAMLLVVAWKTARHDNVEVDPDQNVALKALQRFVPIASSYDGARLTTRVGGRRMATALVPVLVVVATTDLVFAIDSIPAIFAITTDQFIVVTTNVFAMLGLRALYFLLDGVLDRFAYLQQGLAVILAFVGMKMLLAEVVHVPVWASLLVIVLVLAGTIGLSLRAERTDPIAVWEGDDAT